MSQPPLFKYLRKEHAKAMLERGTVRIGTLFEYRDIDKHGHVIGDGQEGTKTLALIGEGDAWTADTMPDFAKSFFEAGPTTTIRLSGVTLEQSRDSLDYYIYCVTDTYDPQALQDFGYDSCVEIVDPWNFFRALNRGIEDRGIYEGCWACRYEPRMRLYTDPGPHAALLKDERYAAQREARALWRPRDASKPLAPFIVDCPEIVPFCRAD